MLANKENVKTLAFLIDVQNHTQGIQEVNNLETDYKESAKLLHADTIACQAITIEGQHFSLVVDDEALLTDKPTPSVLDHNQNVLFCGSCLIYKETVDKDGYYIAKDLTEDQIELIARHISIIVSPENDSVNTIVQPVLIADEMIQSIYLKRKIKGKFKMEANSVKSILKSLSDKGIDEIDDDAVIGEPNAPRYFNLFNKLYEQIIVNTIFDHFNIHEEYDTNVMFKCFAENDGKWFGYFYQPDIKFSVDKVLEHDFSDLKSLDHYLNRGKTNPVDILIYAKAVNDYNSLPIEKRKDWRDLGNTKPFDQPDLFSIYYDNGEDYDVYSLEIIPEWADSASQLDGSGDAYADEYYIDKPMHKKQDLYRQNLKLVVVEYDTTTMDYHRMSYEDFLSDMEAYGVKDKFPELKLSVQAY